MSGGKSSSSSKSTTNTTTQQYDQQVTATDLGVAIGSNAQIGGSLTVDQIPPEVGAVVQTLLATNNNLINIAAEAGQVAISTADQARATEATTTKKWLIMGAICLVVVLLATRGK